MFNFGFVNLPEFVNDYYSPSAIETIKEEIAYLLDDYDKDLVSEDSRLRLIYRLAEFSTLCISKTAVCLSYVSTFRSNQANCKAVEELENLINTLKKFEGRQVDIAFKIAGRDFPVTNSTVSVWIRQRLIEEYDSFDLPPEFGNAVFSLSSKENPLKRLDKSQLLNGYGSKPFDFGRIVYSFVCDVMDYLTGNFMLVKHSAEFMSEQQISFAYQLLAVMGFEGYESLHKTGERPSAIDRDNLYQLLWRRYKKDKQLITKAI